MGSSSTSPPNSQAHLPPQPGSAPLEGPRAKDSSATTQRSPSQPPFSSGGSEPAQASASAGSASQAPQGPFPGGRLRGLPRERPRTEALSPRRPTAHFRRSRCASASRPSEAPAISGQRQAGEEPSRRPGGQAEGKARLPLRPGDVGKGRAALPETLPARLGAPPETSPSCGEPLARPRLPLASPGQPSSFLKGPRRLPWQATAPARAPRALSGGSPARAPHFQQPSPEQLPRNVLGVARAP